MLALVDALPTHSAYGEAVNSDDERATRALDLQTDGKPDEQPRPRLSEWSPVEQLLAAVYDRLGEVVVGLVRQGGGKVNLPDPWPRPETAMERAVKNRQDAEFDELFDLIETARARSTATRERG